MIDTHCHIDLYPNPNKVLQDCVKAEITILAMTNLPSHFEMGYPYFQALKKIRLALGMHPLMANEHKNEFGKFKKLLPLTSYIGEVGLDFSRKGVSTKEIQLQSFKKILELIKGKKKLLSIHSRGAEREVLELLVNYQIQNVIFHWYSGSLHLIKDILDAGFYFSINPEMIKSKTGRLIISHIPIDKVLTESDGPFVTFNNRIINPWEIEITLEELSKVHKMSRIQIEKQINNNFFTLINRLK